MSASIGLGRSRVSRIRREYILARFWLAEPMSTRMARFFTIAHTATSWNRVDLPAPGGTLRQMNSFSSLSKDLTISSAASTCHGADTRPR